MADHGQETPRTDLSIARNQKAAKAVAKRAAKTRKRTPSPEFVANLTETEQDLLSHMEQGYQLETDSLGGDPVLRRLKDNEAIRAMSANRNTVRALEERAFIAPGKGRDPLRIVWHLKKTKQS